MVFTEGIDATGSIPIQPGDGTMCVSESSRVANVSALFMPLISLHALSRLRYHHEALLWLQHHCRRRHADHHRHRLLRSHKRLHPV